MFYSVRRFNKVIHRQQKSSVQNTCQTLDIYFHPRERDLSISTAELALPFGYHGGQYSETHFPVQFYGKGAGESSINGLATGIQGWYNMKPQHHSQ